MPTSYELGKEYKVEWLDHFDTHHETPASAVKMRTTITSWGRCVALSREYLILAHDWESDNSENNDNAHIIRKCIVGSKEIK